MYNFYPWFGIFVRFDFNCPFNFMIVNNVQIEFVEWCWKHLAFERFNHIIFSDKGLLPVDCYITSTLKCHIYSMFLQLIEFYLKHVFVIYIQFRYNANERQIFNFITF